LDRAIAELACYDWLIFTSANGVEHFLGRLWECGGDLRRLAHLQLAAIGPATAAALEKLHLRADVVPAEYRAEALAEVLKPLTAGRRVLWAGASRGRDVLPTELASAGATVEKLIVYRNEDAPALPPAERELVEAGEVDWIGLSSPSIARNLRALLGEAVIGKHIGTRTRLAAISPVTAAAAEEAGLPVAAIATDYTWDGLFAAIRQAEEEGRKA
jgi:uroporphyrinogen III methyltransferase/synthase